MMPALAALTVAAATVSSTAAPAQAAAVSGVKGIDNAGSVGGIGIVEYFRASGGANYDAVLAQLQVLSRVSPSLPCAGTGSRSRHPGTNWCHSSCGTSACATGAIDNYLLKATLPAKGKLCVGEYQPFVTPLPTDPGDASALRATQAQAQRPPVAATLLPSTLNGNR
jgi:hypothetical protein